jgi:hypothetical protein
MTMPKSWIENFYDGFSFDSLNDKICYHWDFDFEDVVYTLEQSWCNISTEGSWDKIDGTIGALQELKKDYDDYHIFKAELEKEIKNIDEIKSFINGEMILQPEYWRCAILLDAIENADIKEWKDNIFGKESFLSLCEDLQVMIDYFPELIAKRIAEQPFIDFNSNTQENYDSDVLVVCDTGEVFISDNYFQYINDNECVCICAHIWNKDTMRSWNCKSKQEFAKDIVYEIEQGIIK